MRHDLGSLAGLVLLPLLMVGFLNPIFGTTLAAQGAQVDGAAIAVPGMAVLFSLFLIGHVGYLIFREHSFGTWERLRASPLSPLEVIVGKAIPVTVLAVVQQVLLFALSVWLFDLQVRGSLPALLAVAVALALCLVAMGFAAAAFLRDAQRLNALSGLLAMVLGGLGGGLTPVESLPAWAQHVAPLSPGYWAVRGYRTVVLDGGSVADVSLAVGVLLLFAAVAAVLAALRFRFEETKVGWE
jgi:ABC-2 type transport system permease protein